MILFTIKKAFFDSWDNFFTTVFFNLFSLSLFLGLFSLISFIANPYIAIALIALSSYVFYLLIIVNNEFARSIVNYEKIELKFIFKIIKNNIKNSILLYLYFLLVFSLFLFAINYYVYSSSGVLSLFLSGLTFWFFIIFLLASVYLIPINTQLDKRFLKIIKKSYILFFDNPLFTIAIILSSVVFLFLSTFILFLFPGIFGVSILWQTAFKLRMYKYDYLEENKETKAKDVPWSTLLYKDRELLGVRTLRNTIFPWKD